MKVLALVDPQNSLFDNVESKSCNYEPVFTVTADFNKDVLIPT
jgi:hypothetical protein